MKTETGIIAHDTKSIADTFRRTAQHEAPLADFTSFRIGGIARWLFRPAGGRETEALLNALGGRPCRILGGGTNILVASEVIEEPVIILPRETSWNILEQTGKHVLIQAAAGMPLATLVRETAARRLSGLEALAGIPGTAGGAVMMNAGGKYGCIGDRVKRVEAYDRDGVGRVLEREDLVFGYRTSSLRGLTVTGLTFSLERRRHIETLTRLQEILSEKRATQPLGQKCAGCVFKNPAGYSAGKLIEEVGMAGVSCGDAVVSRLHANFIVNCGRATASDVLRLIEIVRKKIESEFALNLELEIEIW